MHAPVLTRCLAEGYWVVSEIDVSRKAVVGEVKRKVVMIMILMVKRASA